MWLSTMPCVSSSRERLRQLDESQIAHRAGPEPRIQQVQDRVLDAADVLIDRQPVPDPLIDRGRALVGTREAQEIPRRIDEGIHGVGLAPRRATASRARRIDERGIAQQRIAAAVGHQVLGQHHRQLLVRHRHLAAPLAVDQRNRTAPVALARDTPIAQAPLHALSAQAVALERRRDRIDRHARIQAGEFPRIDQHAGLGVRHCAIARPRPRSRRSRASPPCEWRCHGAARIRSRAHRAPAHP